VRFVRVPLRKFHGDRKSIARRSTGAIALSTLQRQLQPVFANCASLSPKKRMVSPSHRCPCHKKYACLAALGILLTSAQLMNVITGQVSAKVSVAPGSRLSPRAALSFVQRRVWSLPVEFDCRRRCPLSAVSVGSDYRLENLGPAPPLIFQFLQRHGASFDFINGDVLDNSLDARSARHCNGGTPLLELFSLRRRHHEQTSNHDHRRR
jgi:hypothetical protein